MKYPVVGLILVFLMLWGNRLIVFGHNDGGKDDKCTTPPISDSICCKSAADFNNQGAGSTPLTACTAISNCRLLETACTSPIAGEVCQTVFYNKCADSCIYGADSLSCPLVQATACGTGAARATSLVSAPSQAAGSKFGTSGGVCVIDPKAAFVSFKIPTYEELKSIHFTQAKTIAGLVIKNASLTGDKTQADIPLTSTGNHLYHVTGNLNLTANIPGNQTGVIFVDGNLNIGPISGKRLTHGSPSTGLVLVVGGNVNIDQDITMVNAVIISAGVICTASAGTPPSCPPGFTTPLTKASGQLIINGSLINLDPTKQIRFRRTLTNNSQPAELVVAQPKYLAILRDIFSDTLQKWSELP